jgi:predicted RNase H-like HicB family nuclease
VIRFCIGWNCPRVRPSGAPRSVRGPRRLLWINLSLLNVRNVNLIRLRFFDSEKVITTYTAVIERCPATGLLVGYVPGFRSAHSQGETIEELNDNLIEVIEMLLEDGEPELEAEFVGTQALRVG